jgi:hypothetical protein
VAAPGKPQDAARKPSEPARPAATESSSFPKKTKPTLAEITRVSTAEAARGAAHDQAKAEEDVDELKPEESTDPAVVELKSATKEAEPSRGVVANQDSKDSKVHGRVHGSLDSKNSGDHQSGAAVGVGSKSGKTNIYVETERSRRTSPPTR